MIRESGNNENQGLKSCYAFNDMLLNGFQTNRIHKALEFLALVIVCCRVRYNACCHVP